MDSGATWIHSGIPNTIESFRRQGFYALCGNILATVFSLDEQRHHGQTQSMAGGILYRNSLVVAAPRFLRGTNGGGVFRLSDNGTTWLSSGLTNSYINLTISGSTLLREHPATGCFVLNGQMALRGKWLIAA